jgi:undecaprenol kinase
MRFMKRFSHALDGLLHVFRVEASFRFQIFAAVIVAIFIVVLPLATWEQVLLVLMVAAVLVLELMNTILERLADALKPRLDPVVKEVKDMMAGAVLLTSFTAVLVAVMILWDFLTALF